MTKIRLSPSVLTWARSFEAVVRCKSFTKAADGLCITQGAVSQQVRHLEEWARRPLLLRSSRALVPTPEGKWLAAVLTESLQAIDSALSQIRARDADEAMLLSCSPSFAMSWLTPRLGDFYRRVPGVGLKVVGEFQALDGKRMAADGLAAALRFDPGVYPDLVTHEILDEFLVPVASPQFMAEHPEIASPADLDGSFLLHDGEPWVGARPHEEWEHWLEQAGIDVPAAGLLQGRQFNLSLLATGAAAAGQGIAMGRLALVLEDLLAGRLCVPFSMCIRSRASYFLVTSARSPPEVEVARTWLEAQAAEFRQQRDAFLTELQEAKPSRRPGLRAARR